MSFKDRLAAKTALIAPVVDSPNPPLPREPKTAPGAMMKAMPILKEKQAEIDAMSAAMAALRDQMANGTNGAMDIALDQLVEVAGRRRHMSPEKFAELRENLRHNRLIHPIVVRRLPDGKFEIISGHHRIDAYKALGRPMIRAVADDGSDDEASDGAFFANLMQSDLTDYEKYLGFKERQRRYPTMTRAQLAEQSGLSETAISFIRSFDNLPAYVLSICADRPSLLGAGAAFALANLAKQGRSDQVISAVQKLAAGEIDQGQTVKLASIDPARPKVDAAPVSTKIRQGKAVYCEMRRAKNVVRLQFKSEEEATRVHAEIQRVLEAASGAQKGTNETS
ncbi:ParB, partition protein [Caballeronia choica]|uniref:ParB, partition protein n=1 Tax=Caballeronia choica TaxID=326476 RepID=A0A158HXP1_9BURK|nr:ParB/RepB/Spo0J family partition protein [Caballeronia choica]SAL49185.1 ParB, partition protein [Caballeronia choica]